MLLIVGIAIGMLLPTMILPVLLFELAKFGDKEIKWIQIFQLKFSEKTKKEQLL